MKKILTILLITLLSIGARSQESRNFSLGNFDYQIISETDRTVELLPNSNVCNIYTGDISIPDSVLHDGVYYKIVSLGNNVFKQANLSSISIPNSVRTIKYNCFEGARFTSPYKIKLPDSLRTIEQGAFSFTENIIQIFIPALVDNIEMRSFGSSYDLAYIDVDSTNQYFRSIDGVLYSKDSSILMSAPAAISSGTYSILEGVEIIDNFAFERNEIYSVSIPNTVRHIKTAAFSSCNNLSNVSIPASVSNIEGGAFRAVENLHNLTIDSLNAFYKVVDHAIYSMDMDTVVCYLVPTKDTVRIQDGVEIVATNSFAGLKKLKVLILPYGVKEIKECAFIDSKLKAIYLPETLKKIETGSFYGCGYLRELRIPNSVTTIESDAFSMSLVETVVMSDSVKVIPNSAFYGCGLVNYSGGASIERIEKLAFCYCINYGGTVVFPKTLKYIGTQAYQYTGINEVEFTGIIDTIRGSNFGDLRTLKLVNPTPPYSPKVANKVFRVVIPCGATEAYMSDPNWSSYTYVEDCDGIEESEESNVRVVAKSRSIEVLNVEGCSVAIYDAVGRCLVNEPANGNSHRYYNVPTAGVYVVRVDDRGYKVVVSN